MVEQRERLLAQPAPHQTLRFENSESQSQLRAGTCEQLVASLGLLLAAEKIAMQKCSTRMLQSFLRTRRGVTIRQNDKKKGQPGQVHTFVVPPSMQLSGMDECAGHAKIYQILR